MGRLFRFRLAERVTASLKPSSRVLDVGCGTGEDALWLAAQGHAVHGVDVSPRMIDQAQSKAARLGSRATFECRDLMSLAPGGPGYDAVISNFGALNCVPLEFWTESLPRQIRPGGRGFVVVMGNKPLPERMRFKQGRPRTRLAKVPVSGESIDVHYETVSAIREALGRVARVERVEALGCVVPSPASANFARGRPLLIGFLAMGECLVRRAPFFRDRGDHTLFEFTVR